MSKAALERASHGWLNAAAVDLLARHRLDLGSVTVTSQQPFELDLPLPAEWGG